MHVLVSPLLYCNYNFLCFTKKVYKNPRMLRKWNSGLPCYHTVSLPSLLSYHSMFRFSVAEEKQNTRTETTISDSSQLHTWYTHFSDQHAEGFHLFLTTRKHKNIGWAGTIFLDVELPVTSIYDRSNGYQVRYGGGCAPLVLGVFVSVMAALLAYIVAMSVSWQATSHLRGTNTSRKASKPKPSVSYAKPAA